MVTETLVVGADLVHRSLRASHRCWHQEEQWVDLTYAPLSLGEHLGSLWVESDTPAGTAQAS